MVPSRQFAQEAGKKISRQATTKKPRGARRGQVKEMKGSIDAAALPPLWIARNRANIDAARPGCPAWARSSSNKEGMCTFALKGVGLGCVATAEAVSFAPPRSNSPVAGRVRDRHTHTSRRTQRTWSNDIPHAQQHIANHQAEEEGQQQLH